MYPLYPHRHTYPPLPPQVHLGTERGLVGYWRVNEGPGGMVFDHSNYGNLGPVKGDPLWTAANHPITENVN